MECVIDRITEAAAAIKAGDAPVAPGQPERLSEAASPGDFVRQGDLYVTVADSVPSDFQRVEEPSHPDLQLVPDNTEGAKHCLDSLEGVEMWRPEGWGPGWDSQDGPCLVLSEERVIGHPVHGDVTIPAGTIVRCDYQREYDAELRRERRNAD